MVCGVGGRGSALDRDLDPCPHGSGQPAIIMWRAGGGRYKSGGGTWRAAHTTCRVRRSGLVGASTKPINFSGCAPPITPSADLSRVDQSAMLPLYYCLCGVKTTSTIQGEAQTGVHFLAMTTAIDFVSIFRKCDTIVEVISCEKVDL